MSNVHIKHFKNYLNSSVTIVLFFIDIKQLKMGFPENSREGFTMGKIGHTPQNQKKSLHQVSDLQVLG